MTALKSGTAEEADAFSRRPAGGPPSTPKGFRAILNKLLKYHRGFTSTVVIIAVWWAAAAIIDNTLFLVGPFEVVGAIVELTMTGELQEHIAASSASFGIGFALAIVVGVTLGGLMAISRPFRLYVEPVVSALYATPLIAVAPLFILWFGLGITSKVAIVFLIAVFPIIINTLFGLANADSNLVETVDAFGGTRWHSFTKVLLPSSVPFLITGIRLAVARALVGVVVAEMFGARAGLGYLIFLSGQTYQTANLFAAVVVLAVSGVIAMGLLQVLERKLAPWRDQ